MMGTRLFLDATEKTPSFMIKSEKDTSAAV